MTDKILKPCPFCGLNKAAIRLYCDDRTPNPPASVVCKACGVSNAVYYHNPQTGESAADVAAAVWNNRATL